MKKHFLKAIIVLIILCHSTIVSGQSHPAIKDSVLIDIPNIGKTGGAHLLNWSLNEDNNEISFYAYSHVNGSQIISTTQEIEAAKKEHNDKGFFGKLMSAATLDNNYQNTIVPVVLEGSILTKDMSVIDTKKYLFHKVDDLPEGKNVFFKPASGMIDITGFETGTLLDYHYNDLNKAFKYAPTLDKELLSLTELKLKGEGLLGIKNIAPWIVNKKAYFKYVTSKGYISDIEKKDLVNLKETPELQEYEFLRESENNVGKNYIVWFVKKKEDTKYKMVSYNEENGKMTIQSFEFDTPRKPKVITKTVYNKELNPVGFATVFGYHKKGKKSETYAKTDFDIIYMDLTGAVKFQTKFSHGTEKKYKNVVSPLLIINEGDDVLRFINNHQLSLISSQFEIFTLDSTGKLNVELSEAFSAKQGETSINYYNYLVDFDAIYKMGQFYVIRKNDIEKTTESVPNSSIPKSVTLNSGFKYTVLDSNFKPVHFGSLHSGSNQKEDFIYQNIEITEDSFTSLATRAGKYYLTTITPEKTETINLETDLGNNASRMLYFGSYMRDFALVNKDDKEFFILHQYYTKEKVLDKVAILKVGY